MPWSLVALVMLAFVGQAQAAQYKPANPDSRVRPLSAHVEKLLADGMAGSPTFRQMLNRIESSDVIVYIEARPDLRAGVGGVMRFITRSASARFLRIQVSSAQARHVQIAMLGHELRHALEIVDQPGIGTADDLHQFYRERGVRTGLGTFDSIAAQQAGYAVRNELRANRGVRYARATPDDDRALMGASILDESATY